MLLFRLFIDPYFINKTCSDQVWQAEAQAKQCPRRELSAQLVWSKVDHVQPSYNLFLLLKCLSRGAEMTKQVSENDKAGEQCHGAELLCHGAELVRERGMPPRMG